MANILILGPEDEPRPGLVPPLAGSDFGKRAGSIWQTQPLQQTLETANKNRPRSSKINRVHNAGISRAYLEYCRIRDTCRFIFLYFVLWVLFFSVGWMVICAISADPIYMKIFSCLYITWSWGWRCADRCDVTTSLVSWLRSPRAFWALQAHLPASEGSTLLRLSRSEDTEMRRDGWTSRRTPSISRTHLLAKNRVNQITMKCLQITLRYQIGYMRKISVSRNKVVKCLDKSLRSRNRFVRAKAFDHCYAGKLLSLFRLYK